MVLSLNSEIIRPKLNTETVKKGELLLRAFLPGLGMAGLVPGIESIIQGLGRMQYNTDEGKECENLCS